MELAQHPFQLLANVSPRLNITSRSLETERGGFSSKPWFRVMCAVSTFRPQVSVSAGNTPCRRVEEAELKWATSHQKVRAWIQRC